MRNSGASVRGVCGARRSVIAAMGAAALVAGAARGYGPDGVSAGAWADRAVQPRIGAIGDVAAVAHTRLDVSVSRLDAEPDVPSPAGGSGGRDAEFAKKLNNPISDLISVPLQFNYDEGFGPKDAERITLNIQPVIPFTLTPTWNVISRTIVPVIYQGSTATGVSSDFGIGDTVQSLFFSPKEPVGGWIVGAGPVALLPTGTTPRLRNESFGLGPTAVALRQTDGWTFGGLVNHIWSVTESDDHEQVNATFLQPFVAYTWPSATTLTLNAEATYDWSIHEWTAPVNLIGSQVVRVGRQPMSFSLGLRYYVDSPSGGPEWGARCVVTFLFPR